MFGKNKKNKKNKELFEIRDQIDKISSLLITMGEDTGKLFRFTKEDSASIGYLSESITSIINMYKTLDIRLKAIEAALVIPKTKLKEN